jgi:hypothetical protein
MDVMNTMTRSDRRRNWRRIQKRSTRAGDATLESMETVGDCGDCGGTVVFAPPVMCQLILDLESAAPAKNQDGTDAAPTATRNVVVCVGCGRNDFVDDSIAEGGEITVESLAQLATEGGFSGGKTGSPCRIPCPDCESKDRVHEAADGGTARARCNACGAVHPLSVAETFGFTE